MSKDRAHTRSHSLIWANMLASAPFSRLLIGTFRTKEVFQFMSQAELHSNNNNDHLLSSFRIIMRKSVSTEWKWMCRQHSIGYLFKIEMKWIKKRKNNGVFFVVNDEICVRRKNTTIFWRESGMQTIETRWQRDNVVMMKRKKNATWLLWRNVHAEIFNIVYTKCLTFQAFSNTIFSGFNSHMMNHYN